METARFSTEKEITNGQKQIGISLDMLHHIREMQSGSVEKIFEKNKEDIQMLVKETLQQSEKPIDLSKVDQKESTQIQEAAKS